MENKKQSLLSRLKKIKGVEYIVIIIIALLIILILFSDSFTSKENTQSSSVVEYVSTLESKLERTLSKIKGVGNVSVVITVNGGNKTVIATDVTTVKNGTEVKITEAPVLVGGKVVVLNELYPEITGVMIVAGGADNLSVKLNVMTATTTLLSIDESKVSILTGK